MKFPLSFPRPDAVSRTRASLALLVPAVLLLGAAILGTLAPSPGRASADASAAPAPGQESGEAVAGDETEAEETESTASAAGRDAFQAHKCGLCHGVEAAGIQAKTKSEKMKGPDLGGYDTDDPEALAAYLRKQAELDGEEHNREFKGTDEELTAILSWLGTHAAP